MSLINAKAVHSYATSGGENQALLRKSVQIRQLRESDCSGLIALDQSLQMESRTDRLIEYARVFPFPYLPGGRSAELWVRENLAMMQATDAIFHVAEVKGELIGMCRTVNALLLISGLPPEFEDTGLLSITIRNDYRRNGIGKELMHKTLSESKGRFDFISLRVHELNFHATHLYKKFGFASSKLYGMEIPSSDPMKPMELGLRKYDGKPS